MKIGVVGSGQGGHIRHAVHDVGGRLKSLCGYDAHSARDRQFDPQDTGACWRCRKAIEKRERRQFGVLLRAAREAASVSRYNLARHLGFKTPDLNAIERGAWPPNDDRIFGAAAFLSADPVPLLVAAMRVRDCVPARLFSGLVLEGAARDVVAEVSGGES